MFADESNDESDPTVIENFDNNCGDCGSYKSPQLLSKFQTWFSKLMCN